MIQSPAVKIAKKPGKAQNYISEKPAKEPEATIEVVSDYQDINATKPSIQTPSKSKPKIRIRRASIIQKSDSKDITPKLSLKSTSQPRISESGSKRKILPNELI